MTGIPSLRFRPVLLTGIAIVLLQAACSQGEGAGEASTPGVPRVEAEQVITAGTPVTMADLSISGMSCEMMCGGAIKKALAALPGVSGTEIAFTEGDAGDHAIVTYDPALVSDAQLVEAVQRIHDGQYKVMAVTVTRQVKSADIGAGEEAEGSADGKVNAELPSFRLPNLLALLTFILRA